MGNLVRRIARLTHPYGSVRRVLLGPLIGTKFRCRPAMAASFALGAKAMHYDAFARYINPGMTVLDVGAHLGQMSLFFSRAVRSYGRVVAIEPNAESFAALTDNLALAGCANVTTHNFAAGERSEVAELVCAGGMSQIAGAASGYVVDGERQPVGINTIDSLDLMPDFIKIDVEGFADRVLRGARDTIKWHRPKFFVDLHSPEEVAAVKSELLSRGYSAFGVDGRSVEVGGHGAWAVFCVHPG